MPTRRLRSPRPGPDRRAVALGSLALAGLLAACTSPGPTPAAAPVSAPSQAAESVAPDPTEVPAIRTTSPLSGREGGVDAPIVVVKLDNTPAAQPHRGLTEADIVYVEPVEWGLTRLAAVFATKVPKVVGPVRSARISDIELFEQFGPVAFVYSGAQHRLWSKLQAADWYPMSQDFGSSGFHRERGTGRYAPTNLMADPRVMLDQAGDGVARTRDLGWVFDEQRPDGGTKATRVTARWPESSVQFRWNADQRAYDVWMNGRPARDTAGPKVQRASTAIIQYVKEVDSGYGDKFGGRTPLAVTVGQGKALLLRDGRAYRIRWERPTAADPTTYLDPDGRPLPFAPGQVWILLQAKERKASIG
ncbi:MAG TPA: DUF3048 domain-containing protein [Candidatus Nanopelagicales bacterium]